MEDRDPKEPKIDPEIAKRLKIFHALANLGDRSEDERREILIQLAEIALDNNAWQEVKKEEQEQYERRFTHLNEMLSGADATKFKKASEEALRNGGIERWPEIGSLSLEMMGAKIEISDREKLPRTNEEKYAYMLYRKGGLNPEAALLFATKGFIFNDVGESPYIPVSTAIEISKLASGMVDDRDVPIDPEEVMEVFLDENDFGIEDINPSTQILIESESLKSVGSNGVFRRLPEITKNEILKDYVGKGKSVLQENYPDI